MTGDLVTRLSRRSFLAGVTVGPVLLSTQPLAALCAGGSDRWIVRSGSPVVRPRGSGFLVVRSDEPGTHVASLETVRLVGAGQTPHVLAREELGRDLVVLRIPAEIPGGHYTLRGVGPTETSIELVEAPIETLPAPRGPSLRRRRSREGGPRGMTLTDALVVSLAGTPPDRALVVAQWTEDGAEASTWGTIERTSGRTTATLAYVGRCSGHGRFPPDGVQITVRYVDALGQIGTPSRALRVPR